MERAFIFSSGIYIVSAVPDCITDILADYMSDEEDCDMHFERFEYGLEGIGEDGDYCYWEHGWTGYISEKNMKRFEGEIKNESLLPILQKMVLNELPKIYDVFDRSLVDTGYNHMIPYTKLFKLDEKEIERN